MKKIITTLFSALLFTLSYGQTYKWLKNAPDGSVITTTPSVTPLATAKDFTITFTDGSTKSLYSTLAQGKTVVLDFFFTTCSYCIQYAPVIDQSYVANGSGNGKILYWGLDYNDNTAAVNSYKSAHGVTNPCASGVEGKATSVSTLYGVSAYPTYCVVCPDKTLSFDVNYPPTVPGFNSYFATCGATGVNEELNANGSITDVYPNPASVNTQIKFNLKESSSVRFELYNMVGEKVFYYEESNVAAGPSQLDLPVRGIANGLYTLKMFQNGQVTDVKKIVIGN